MIKKNLVVFPLDKNSSRDFPNGYIGEPLRFSYYIFKIEIKRRKEYERT